MKNYEMKQSYQRAFEDTIQKINGNYHGRISIHRQSQFQKKTAEAGSPSSYDGTSKLIMTFESNKRRTSYGFEMNPIKNNEFASSLAFSTKKGSRDEGGIMCYTAAMGRDGVPAPEGITSRLWDQTSMAVNASSYGEMFKDYDCQEDPNAPDRANMNYDGISQQARQAMCVLVNKQFETGNPGYDAIFDEIMRDPAAYFSNDPQGFVEWSVSQFEDAEPYQKESMDPAWNFAARQMLLNFKEFEGKSRDENYEIPIEDVKKAYGLAALEQMCAEVAKDLKEKPDDVIDLNDYISKSNGFPDAAGLQVLDGLNALTAYREICATSLEYTDTTLRASFDTADSLESCNVKHPKGSASKYTDVGPIQKQFAADACYPKFNSGQRGMQGDPLRRWEAYKICNAFIRNTAPELPINVPAVKFVYSGDIASKQINMRDITVVFPESDSHKERAVGYNEFMNVRTPLMPPEIENARKDLLDKLPFLKYDLEQNGGDDLKDMIVGKNKAWSHKENSFDILNFELKLYAQQAAQGSLLPVRDQMEYQDHVSFINELRRSHYQNGGLTVIETDHMAGIPSEKTGQFEFGALIKDAALKSGPVSLDKKSESRMLRDRNVTMSAEAKAIRNFDQVASVVLDKTQDYESGLKADKFGGYRAFVRCIDEYTDVGANTSHDDVMRNGMKLNDLLILSDCYKLRSEGDIQALHDDIEKMYAGKPDNYLYRPKGQDEIDAFRILAKSPRFDKSCVTTNLSESRDFKEVVGACLDHDGSQASELSKSMQLKARQMDTFESHSHYDIKLMADEAAYENSGRGTMDRKKSDMETQMAEQLENEFDQFNKI